MRREKWKKMIASILLVVTCIGNTGLTSLATEEPTKETKQMTISENDSEPKEKPEEPVQKEKAEEVVVVEEEQKKEKENSGDGYPNVYYGEQSLEEMIKILSNGRNPEEFFKYSIWTFLTADDLIYLRDNGLGLAELFDYLWGYADYSHMEGMVSLYERYHSRPSSRAATATVTFGADISSSALGVIPAFGSGSHGPMKSIYLNGVTAICARYGASCSTGMTYTEAAYSSLGISDAQHILMTRIYSWYQAAQAINNNTANLAITQAAYWLVLNNNWADAGTMASAIEPLFGKVSVLDYATSYNLFTGMANWVNGGNNVANYSLIYWANGTNQYLVTGYHNPQPVDYSAYVKLTKTDAITGDAINAKAEFKIYDEDGKDTGATFSKSGNVYTSSTIKTQTAGSKYYVMETTSPTGYLAHSKKYPFTIDAGDNNKEKPITNSGTKFTNEPSSAYVVIDKTDAVTGEAINAKAEFKIYDAKGKDTGAKFTKSGNSYTSSMVYCRSASNIFYVKEISAPVGYLLDTEEYSFTIKTTDDGAKKTISNNAKKTFDNTGYYVYLKIPKADADTQKAIAANAVFTVSAASGQLSQTVTFTKQPDGSYLSSAVYYNESNSGIFYVQETCAPNGYYGDWESESGGKTPGSNNNKIKYAFTAKANNSGSTIPITTGANVFSNTPVTGSISIAKVDKERGTNHAQGDATLEGAVYGLYAKTDIRYPDGTSGVKYPAGTLVCTLTTDKDGKANVTKLFLGNYYLKELKASEGYCLDQTIYDVTLSYKDESVLVITKSQTLPEQVKKQAFEMIKIGDDGSTSEAELLQAGFTIYLIGSLRGVKEGLIKPDTDGEYKPEQFIDYDFTKEKAAIDYSKDKNGVVIPELFTDSKGYLRSPELAYGKYIVVESTIPDEYLRINPFIVKIENDSRTPQVWRVFIDDAFRAKIKVIKADSESKETILKEGAKYRIFDLDNKKYVEQWITYPNKILYGTKENPYAVSEEGYLITPATLSVGNYRLEEVEAPDGYVLNGKEGYSKDGITIYEPKEEVVFRISTDEAYQIDGDTAEAVITVIQKNDSQTGSLRLYKQGEKLDRYKEDFVYSLAGVEGAEFEVYAKEVIYSPDNQGSILFEKDQLIDTIVTDTKGMGYLDNLPLGSYYVEETEAGFGFILNEEKKEFTLSYAGQEVCVVYEDMEYTNERQKFLLSVEKLDEETDLPIGGAVFGLYTAGDILNTEDKVMVEADTLIETAVSDTNGMVIFAADLPFGDYYVKELQAPAGYLLSEEIIEVAFEYEGQDMAVVKFESIFYNTPTTTEFTKTDITSGEELSGATLSVIDQNGTIVETWTSDAEEPHVIRGLVVGETYILREEFAPYGYLKAEEVIFTVEDTEEVQCVEMQDAVPTGTIVINKDGEFLQDINLVKHKWYDFLFDYFKKDLSGVTFELYAAEDIVSPDGLDEVYYAEDEFVSELITNEKGAAGIEDLPLGNYYLIETETLDGFVLDGTPIEVELAYVDQYTEVVYAGMDVFNERQKVEITVVKTDAETKEALKGAVFGLFAKEDIRNTDGTILVQKDSLVEKAVTGKEGTCLFLSDLPLGKYYVKEIEPPKGYASTKKIVEVDAAYKGSDVAVIECVAEFENKPIKVEISKTDITGEEELPGARLSIINEKGKVVETWISTEESHKIEQLPVGKYTLREEIAPKGYVIANDVEFIVKDTGKVQKVFMKDDTTKGKIVLHKTDAVSGNDISGVEFEIRNEDGKVVETLITDANGFAKSGELAIGVYENGIFLEEISYYVVETKAAEGYLLNETAKEVVFEWKDGKEPVIEVLLEIQNEPIRSKLPQTGDPFSAWLFAGAGILCLIAGLFLNKRKLKK